MSKDEEHPESGLIKRTPIDDNGGTFDDDENDIPDYYDDNENNTSYKGKEYNIDANDGKTPVSVPSMIDEAREEDSHSEESEREALESEIIAKLKRDRDPVGSVDYTPNGNVDPEEEKRAIRVLLRQNDSLDGIKMISSKFGIDMKKVLAIKDEIYEEKRRTEAEQTYLMQERMKEIRNPEIPRSTPRNLRHEEKDDDDGYRESRYEQQFDRHVNPPPQQQPDIMSSLLTFMLNQATTSDKRSFEMMQLMMQNQQNQMNMFMEMNNKGNKGGFFDGEFGDVMKAKMMSNVLSPGGGESSVSGTALILKGLVDSGQLGGILTEATGLLRDMASNSKEEGFEPLNIDSGDISRLPPQYRKDQRPPPQQPQQQLPPPQQKREEDYPEDEFDDYSDVGYEDFDYDEHGGPTKATEPPKRTDVRQSHTKTSPPNGVEFEPNSPEWFAQKIIERFPDIEWDVAQKSSELVIKRAKIAGVNMADQNEQKEIAYSILAIIGGAQGVITLARSAREIMEFDSKGKAKRSPEEAAEFIKEHMPERVGVIKAFDWDMMMETTKHFENCKSMAKAIQFLKHDKISPYVKRFLMAVKTSPMSKNPPNTDNDLFGDIGSSENGHDENPFGGF